MNMNSQTTLTIAAVAGAVTVILGASGAHGLKEILATHQSTEVYKLAIDYQFYHVFALALTGLFKHHYTSPKLTYAAFCFIGGILLFSGSLLLLSLSGIKILGAITPIGGVCFIAGWLLLALGLKK